MAFVYNKNLTTNSSSTKREHNYSPLNSSIDWSQSICDTTSPESKATTITTTKTATTTTSTGNSLETKMPPEWSSWATFNCTVKKTRRQKLDRGLVQHAIFMAKNLKLCDFLTGFRLNFKQF